MLEIDKIHKVYIARALGKIENSSKFTISKCIFHILYMKKQCILYQKKMLFTDALKKMK